MDLQLNSTWNYLKKFHLEKIIQLEYTNHSVTHPTINHDLVATSKIVHQLDPLRHTISY